MKVLVLEFFSQTPHGRRSADAFVTEVKSIFTSLIRTGVDFDVLTGLEGLETYVYKREVWDGNDTAAVAQQTTLRDQANNCALRKFSALDFIAVSYTHLRAHETPEHLVCRLLLEKKKKPQYVNILSFIYVYKKMNNTT
eukprot:TRINITY_DN14699_c0_g2_i1.p1 TRINITY_DN14699_c0_g2~~TRINITY_DN14699_c0_g2_i1.p1  ORF type:complete len:139 (+),score=33.01 TRINITY_DN14699_c0_g2_i1:101-517(+)